jgi:hypothetical protein
VVTVDEQSEHDAVPEPTPLPELDRGRFFGRGEELEAELVGMLDGLGYEQRVLDEVSDPVSVPFGVRGIEPLMPPEPASSPSVEREPEIRIDEPVEATNSPAYGTAIPASPDALLRTARDLFQLHDFGGAIDSLERLVELVPNHAEGRTLLAQCRSHLTRMLESKIGDLERVPRLLISSEEVIWLNLNHRAGFILSQIDGAVSYDDIIALSGMPRLDTLRILVELLQNRVIG